MNFSHYPEDWVELPSQEPSIYAVEPETAATFKLTSGGENGMLFTGTSGEVFELTPIGDAEDTSPTPAEDTSAEAGLATDDDYSNLSYWQRVRKLWDAGKEDFKTAGLGQKLGLLAMAGWFAYEWGPGNEAVTPIIAGQVLNHTNGIAAPLATSAIAGAFTFVQQTASGVTTAYTESTFPKLAETSYKLFNEDEDGENKHKEWKDLPAATKFFYAFLIGTTWSVTREAVVTGNEDKAKLYRTALGSAAVAGTAVAGIGMAAGALKWKADGTSFQPYSDWIIDKMENPLTWLGLFGAAALYNQSKNKWIPQLKQKIADYKQARAGSHEQA